MSDFKLDIWSVSQKTSKDDTLIQKNKLSSMEDQYNFILGNTDSLPQVYNKIMDLALETKCDALVLMHDDAWFDEPPREKIINLIEEFDVLGVAGASKITIKHPALWHIMVERGFSHGKVNHIDDIGNKYLTNFGTCPSRAIIIDGVFMAFSREALKNIRFDEKNPCKFHFYDLDISLNAHLAGLKVGVGDIPITHASLGLREITQDWLTGEKWFLNKYGN
jgi:hypothetical protein